MPFLENDHGLVVVVEDDFVVVVVLVVVVVVVVDVLEVVDVVVDDVVVDDVVVDDVEVVDVLLVLVVVVGVEIRSVQKTTYSQLKILSASVRLAGSFVGSGVARWQNVDFVGVTVWARLRRPVVA